MARQTIIGFLLCVALCFACTGRAGRTTARPRRLVLIVLDQFRPDYVRSLNLPNVSALARRAAVFENAWVGHLPATTVISHEVLPRGRFPANLAWGDDLFHDVEGSVGEKGRIYDPGEFPRETVEKLLAPHDRTHFVRAVAGGGRFLAVGQKRYAVFAMAGSLADTVMTFSETLGKEAGVWEGWARPDGSRIDAFLREPPGSRFWVDTRPTLGTDSSVYKLGGYKYAPLLTSSHAGGDAWVADAAMRLMEDGDWRVAMLTFGAVDRVGHMFGADLEFASPNPHLPFASVVRFADAQVGRVLEFLRRKGYERDTLVIVTADHAGMGARNWHGVDRPGGALDNWMWGEVSNVKTSLVLRPILKPLQELGLRAAYTDTMLRLYFHPGSDLKRAAAVAAKLPGVIWVGEKHATSSGFAYEPVYNAAGVLAQEPRQWMVSRLPQLVRSYASKSSPDLIAVLDAETSYGQPGDHGGAQEIVQRIPLWIAGPGIQVGQYRQPARLVDIAPTVWEIFSGYVPAGMDGTSLAGAILF